jgi:hypothetical protein
MRRELTPALLTHNDELESDANFRRATPPHPATLVAAEIE